MTSLPSGGLRTPRDSLLQDNPAMSLSPIPTTSGDRAIHQQAQQALYRGISTSSGSVCRPLTYSAVTNRYSSDSSLPVNSTPVVPSGVHTPNFVRFQHGSRSGYHSAPPAHNGYFRDPFDSQGSSPSYFGPNQLYFSSACHPSNTDHPFRTHPPPPPHGLMAHPVGSPNWIPGSCLEPVLPSVPEQVGDTTSIPDFLSGDIPFETQSVGCQVHDDDIFGLGRVSPSYGPPGNQFHSFPPQVVPSPGYPVPVTPVVVKDASKLNIPVFNDKKMTWTTYAPKLHAALLECDMSYLLHAECTNVSNAHHSKELMLQ